MPKAQIDVESLLADNDPAELVEDKPKRSRRPKTGELLADEPSEREILAAALNLPDDEFAVSVAGYDLRLVELGFLESKEYLLALLPAVEKSVKDLIPLVNTLQSSYFFMQNFNSDNVENFRLTITEGADDGELLQILENWGLPGAGLEMVAELKAASSSQVRFSNHLSWLFMSPMVDSLKSIRLSDIILDAVDLLPELATRSILRALKKAGEEFDAGEVRQRLQEEADVFDLLDVAVKQILLYKKNGKLRNFTRPIRRLIGLEAS